jgi:hypothetical protein
VSLVPVRNILSPLELKPLKYKRSRCGTQETPSGRKNQLEMRMLPIVRIDNADISIVVVKITFTVRLIS